MDIQLSVQRLLLGAAIAVISLETQGAELVGRVVAIADGDTLTVLDGERRQYSVRLQGIDAHEKGQDYWRVSKQYLADQVFSQSVTIEYEKTDRYSRLVGRVIRDGKDTHPEMLHGGAAWLYRRYERELSEDMRLTYAAAEASSRDGHKGLWQSPFAVSPWEWRVQKRSKK